MPPKFADDENVPKQERTEEGTSGAEKGSFMEESALQESSGVEVNSSSALQAQNERPWAEPAVASQKILREIFHAGGKTAAELEQLLSTYSTTMEWASFWAREGFLTEVISGSERRFTLSQRAVLELELV